MLVKDVRLQIALTLLVISLLSLLRFFSLQIVLTLIILITVGQIIDIVFTYLTQKKYFFSYSALVTSLLVFLVVDRNSSLLISTLAVLVAISSKYIFKINKRHIFNPAAFGILIASLVAKTSPSWWGTSWINWLPIIIILGSFSVLKRLRRLYIVLGFLVIYIFYTLISTFHFNLLFFLDGTLILFSFVMLPEPQTTPALEHWNKTFGLFVGLLLIVFSKFLGGLNMDPLLLSLLTADGISFLLINRFAKSV